METSPLELTAELRLRRWARHNYVPANRRSETWHPVVLQEMRCRDEELGEQCDRARPAGQYVPLAPTLLDAGPQQPSTQPTSRLRRAASSNGQPEKSV